MATVQTEGDEGSQVIGGVSCEEEEELYHIVAACSGDEAKAMVNVDEEGIKGAINFETETSSGPRWRYCCHTM